MPATSCRSRPAWRRQSTISALIRVFIGTEPKQVRAERVLEYSIRKHASVDVDITMMRRGDPGFDWDEGPTGFTLFRFAIPELCGFEGFAIYLDCDMVVRRDIAELYEYRMPGRWVCHPHKEGDCVSVIDCSATDITINRIKGLRKWHVREMLKPIVDRSLPDEWNTLDKVGGALTHFTGLATQPWMTNNPHPDLAAVKLWYDTEREMNASPLSEVRH